MFNEVVSYSIDDYGNVTIFVGNRSIATICDCKSLSADELDKLVDAVSNEYLENPMTIKRKLPMFSKEDLWEILGVFALMTSIVILIYLWALNTI